MKEDGLSGLALMRIHKHDVSLNSQDIVDDFATSGSRRMKLLLGWPIVQFLKWPEKRVPF